MQPVGENARMLKELIARRKQLVEQTVANKSQREHVTIPSVRKSIDRTIKHLCEEIRQVEKVIQDLIDKSRDLQMLYGKTTVDTSGSFGDCEITSETPPVNTTQPNSLYVIMISAAEALCGEEDVYGKLCEEACATSTDRPFAVEGLIVRAIPLVLKTLPPNSKSAPPSQMNYRSRVASAYFEDERNVVASLISAEGLKQATWCLGADAGTDGGVPIGVIARAGSATVFLDAWIARRELIDTPARRYWQWRMMMRPWDVFLAQILQFQCQLRDLYRNLPDPGVQVNPCGGAADVINEAATAIAELRTYYEATTARFVEINRELIPFAGGATRLSDLNLKLETIQKALSALPADRWLINGGILELPSAGYLPVVPGVETTINQQVRLLMGEGVDLRFCVVRPDYVAHALEEAQHMERISLIEGLDDQKKKPQVDILVPNGEILDQKQLSPGRGFQASVDVSAGLFLEAHGAASFARSQFQSLNFLGAARLDMLPSGGGAVYLSCEYQKDALPNSSSNLFPIESTQPVAGTPATSDTPPLEVELRTVEINLPDVVPVQPRGGLWMSLSCERNVFELKLGDKTNFNARAIIAFSSDWPCTWPPDPFVSIQQATTRQVWKSADTGGIAGEPLDGAAQAGAVATGAGYVPEERITVADAIRAEREKNGIPIPKGTWQRIAKAAQAVGVKPPM